MWTVLYKISQNASKKFPKGDTFKFPKKVSKNEKKTAQMCELKISNSFLQSYIEMTWIEFKKHIEKISNYL